MAKFSVGIPLAAAIKLSNQVGESVMLQAPVYQACNEFKLVSGISLEYRCSQNYNNNIHNNRLDIF